MLPRGKHPARFIVFEGGDGAGKTTVCAHIADRLEAAGVPHIRVREPGGTPTGERIRDLLGVDLTPWAEAFAFLVARAENVAKVIRPALDSGTTVLCDRFALSTFAYQSYGRGLDLATLRVANDAVTGGLEPGLTLFLDIRPEDALRRQDGRDDAIRTGAMDLDFHRRVYEGYLELIETAPAPVVRIDATRPLHAVVDDCWRHIMRD